MQTPVQVDFQDVDAPERFHEIITENVADLERRYGRVTACRVAIRGPGKHRQTGGLYEVGIQLDLPNGREVNISRTPKLDERRSDPLFAINDAFKRARRILQDRVRRMQGKVKQHEGQPVGTVLKIDHNGEFGIIEAADGQNVYFHRNSVLNNEFDKIGVGTRVVYVEQVGDKGSQASTVKLLGKHKMR